MRTINNYAQTLDVIQLSQDRIYDSPIAAIRDNSQATYTVDEVQAIVDEAVTQTRKSVLDDLLGTSSTSKWVWIGGGAALGFGLSMLLK